VQESAAVPTIGDMNDPNVYRTLGEHSARLKALEEGSKAANEKLDVLLERSAQAKGARGMLWKVGGAAGTGGGVLVAIASWWLEHFGPKGGTP
jgi:sporulation-control protein spo0M